MRHLSHLHRYICPLRSGPRQQTRSVKRMKSTLGVDVNCVANCEIDSHADTTCAGPNFRMIHTTGETCDVHGFHPTMDAVEDIPVATCATVYTDEDGHDHLLIFNQALYFGNNMSHSLINPNQIRITGTILNDNPFDRDANFGIDHENLNLPFKTDGTTIYFSSRPPTDAELKDLMPIVMTDDEPWDPSTVNLRECAVAKVAQVTIKGSVSEADCVLASISDSLVEERMAQQLISSVNVKTSQLVSNTRHSKVTPEHLSRTWNVGLDTAKKTLKMTTQSGIRHALHPLHRRYRVDHLDLNKRRLNDRFSMDHMLAKTVSLNGNKGAFVYTNGKFTKVYPVSTQAKVAETLTDFSDDVGIPSDLRVDLAPEMEGRHTAFQQEVR